MIYYPRDGGYDLSRMMASWILGQVTYTAILIFVWHSLFLRDKSGIQMNVLKSEVTATLRFSHGFWANPWKWGFIINHNT